MSDEPEITFADPDGRRGYYVLKFPLIYKGERIERIGLKRMTVKEVDAYARAIDEAGRVEKDTGERRVVPFPIFDVPDVVLQNIDAEDNELLAEKMQGFLPPSFLKG